MSYIINNAAFKPKDYHYSLVEYLNKELKQNNVKCRKKVSYIDVDVYKPIEGVYNKIVVDCFNGKIYLRGNDVKDKYILKIRRFGGYRDSDALYCAKGACKQIIRLLNKLSDEHNLEKTGSNNLIDMRSKLKVKNEKTTSLIKHMDLRGKLKVKNEKIASRDYAIAIIDGKIYEGDTHGECVTKYLNEIGIEGIEFYDRIDLRENLGYNFYSQFAAAHVVGNKIYLDNYSLENITAEQCVQILKSKYPDSEILDYDTMQKLAIYLDKNNRDSAILYVDGNVLEGNEHWPLMKEYAKNEFNIVRENYDTDSQYENAIEEIFDAGSYATGNKLGDAIYFEEDFLTNCSEEEIESAVNSTFPNYEVIFHEYDADACREYIDNYQKNSVANKVNRRGVKMKRLVRKITAINWDELEQNNKEIVNYLESNGWTQNGVGIYVNGEYSIVDCIDTMSEQIMLYTTERVDTGSASGYMKISGDSFAINTLEGLKDLLNKLN